MKRRKEWIYGDPSVRLPVILLRSDAWKDLSYPAQMLYVYMRASIFDQDNGYRNTVEGAVKFGPTDVVRYGMDKRTYYRALNDLLKHGIVEEVEAGFGGRKAIYNLLTLDWVERGG